MKFGYIFSDFVDGHSEVLGIDYQNEEECRFQIRVYDSDLIKTNERTISSILLDLIDIGAAVYQADWLSFRERELKRHIQVELPLRNFELFNNCKHKEELERLLFWYTSDIWEFKFVNRTNGLKFVARSPKLFTYQVDTEVALWSGGLDSFAGLMKRYRNNPSINYTLVGSGSNDSMIGKQRELHSALQERLRSLIKLVQLPINPKYPNGRFRTNDYFRSRGFVFKLFGAVVAVLEGQNKLFVYENGYGAINLPFQKTEIGVDHTRSIHPKSLEDMGLFISSLLEEEFHYINPFVLQTKAQMCAGLEEFSDLIWTTFSCDGPYRLPNQPRQCGYCSSCLLRRISLLDAFGVDATEYLIVSDPTIINESHIRVFEMMKRQVDDLTQTLQFHKTWSELLSLYPELRICYKPISRSLNISLDDTRNGLIDLYIRHCQEWMHAVGELTRPFDRLVIV